jgi:hypothetical protein
MRRVDMSPTIGRVRDPATKDALREIELASAEFNLVDIAAPFTITGTYTETRTLNVGVSTLAETQAFIATLIEDLKRGGESRST